MMARRAVRSSFMILGLLVLAALPFGTTVPPRAAPASAPAGVDFNRQILPILADNCFACHGPDEKQRKAKLRMDTREGLFGELKNGGFSVVPGKSADSGLIQRITATNPKEVMPPAKSTKKLTPQQIALLRQWIDEGARWSVHWSFTPPRKSELPRVSDVKWCRNPIDHFILARLDAEGLKPMPEADRTALIRRLSLDLTGLPPTPAEVDAFLADTTPEAYEKLVDRLMQSPRFGEHFARSWLDAARYGDTHGLHLDNYREMWPYRDWVIRAFNNNLPYDRFVIEQLAGDLLANAKLDQLVATGFTRCHVTTSEGGSIEDECYVRNVSDRMETVGTVFMGMTLICGRCHDHKYDPFTTKEYYSFFAFFNSLDGRPLDGNAAQHPPVVKVATPEQLAALDRLEQKVQAIRKKVAAEVALVKLEEPAEVKVPEKPKRTEFVWIEDDLPAGVKPSTNGGPNGAWTFVTAPKPVFSGSKASAQTATGIGQHFFTDASPGLEVGSGDVLFAHVYLDPARPPREVMLQWHTDAWKHRAYWGENVIPWGAEGSPERLAVGPLPETGKWVRLEIEAAKVGIKPGTRITGWAFTQFDGTVYWDRAGIVTATPQGQDRSDSFTAWLRKAQSTGGANLPKPIQDIIKVDAAKRNPAQKQQLRDHFIQYVWARTRSTFEPLNKELASAEKERDQLDKQLPTTLVFKERAEPKPSFILKRGEYDQKGEQVGRDTPAFLPPLPPNAPRNRLGLAEWMVAPEHPLTARVAVNRLWQQVFGTGIVRTMEDFGTQGEPPSHPQLLDWLAIQFREDGWDVKGMVKRLVMSASYRQSARSTPDRLAKDPVNRLLSRGPRYRLDAEMLRDQALFVGGLLVEKVGGPSVKPPQPSGLWEAVGYTSSNTARFTADTGHDKVHRRSMYTFWKRTAPPPQMSAADAPSREACTVRRERTNTPLQALMLMNETQYVECARALAERVLREGGSKVDDRLIFLFRMATSRRPDAQELAELRSAWKDFLAGYTANVEAARKLIAVGETKPDDKLNPSELAAWTMIANLVLNLDEALNKG